ncbi:MAG: FAD-binding oxidoreductase [Pirellulales bacterium]
MVYHDQESTRKLYQLEGVACLSSQQAASCDPYRFAHALLHDASLQGAKIVDRTEIVDVKSIGPEMLLTTGDNLCIRCRWLVIATGYESVKWLPEKVLNLDNTYAIVSEPLKDSDLGGWDPHWMLWEAKDPYLYLRITSDRRLLVGGEDERFHSPARRQAQLETKAKTLEKKARHLIPFVSFATDYCWAGTFGKTHDGLAYIDRHPQHPQILFALGFGGNGITFSQIATDILSAELAGSPLPHQALFAFHR